MCIMVLVLEDNSEIVAHVRSNLCNLICSRRLIRPRAQRPIFLHACAACSELPSYMSTMMCIV